MIYNFNNMEYFKICACSGSFKEFKNDDKQYPTEFLRALKNCINFNKFEGYNWMTDEIYKIQTTFPNDINVPEVQYCLEYLVYCQNNSNYSNCLKPSLWTFINNFLGIKCDSYYDYLLMNYLAHMKYTEHSNAIRCSSYNTSKTFQSDSDRLNDINKYVNESINKTWNISNINRHWLITKN